MRKRYDKAFKAKVTIEAVRGEKTLQEIGMAYSVQPNLIALWKKQLLEGILSQDSLRHEEGINYEIFRGGAKLP